MLGYFGKNIASTDTPVIKGGNFSLLQSHTHKPLGGLHMHMYVFGSCVHSKDVGRYLSNLNNKTLDA